MDDQKRETTCPEIKWGSTNLWPESYSTKVNGMIVGAKQKDTVENYLNKQVCQGKMTLAEAQKEISTDWYKVYVNMPKKKSK